jgi:hypothetical protein
MIIRLSRPVEEQAGLVGFVATPAFMGIMPDIDARWFVRRLTLFGTDQRG